MNHNICSRSRETWINSINMIMMTRLTVAAAADPSEIQEGGEVHSRLLVGGKGGGREEGDNPDSSRQLLGCLVQPVHHL